MDMQPEPRAITPKIPKIREITPVASEAGQSDIDVDQ